MNHQFNHIRDYYGIAIEKGMHVTDKRGNRGVIVGASNYVKVKIEGEKGSRNYHPEALAYPALGYTGKEFAESPSRPIPKDAP